MLDGIHCPGCSHPTTCKTHGCALIEHRRNLIAARIEQEMREYSEGAYAEYRDTKNQLERFAQDVIRISQGEGR